MSPSRHLPVIALALLPLLASCSSFGLGQPSSPAPVARAVDSRTDDLAAMIYAFDLPAGVQPVANGTVASFDAGGPGNAGRHMRAVLSFADGDGIDGQLPPPAAGRTYYLFGLADRDKAALRAAQAWVGRQAPPPAIAFAVSPALCAIHAVDPAATVSIIPVLPGQPQLLPLATSVIGAMPACKA